MWLPLLSICMTVIDLAFSFYFIIFLMLENWCVNSQSNYFFRYFFRLFKGRYALTLAFETWQLKCGLFFPHFEHYSNFLWGDRTLLWREGRGNQGKNSLDSNLHPCSNTCLQHVHGQNLLLDFCIILFVIFGIHYLVSFSFFFALLCFYFYLFLLSYLESIFCFVLFMRITERVDCKLV